MAQTFFADPYVQAGFTLDGVVCVCDAGSFALPDAEGLGGSPEAALVAEQLALADVCLLNKCDLVNGARRDAIAEKIKAANPSAKVVPCRQGKVNLGQVLDLDAFSVEKALECRTEPPWRPFTHAAAPKTTCVQTRTAQSSYWSMEEQWKSIKIP